MQSELQAIQLDATQNVKQNWWSSLDDLIVIGYVVTQNPARRYTEREAKLVELVG